MAYTYQKLTDVTLVNSAVEPNLLIEDGGDIKKISASNIAVPQVKADWNETDATSAAFILNKPDLSQVGGGANVVTYTLGSGALMLNGVVTTAQAVIDEWNNGSILRIDETDTVSGGSIGEVPNISYAISSGSLASTTVYYYSNGTISSVTIY